MEAGPLFADVAVVIEAHPRRAVASITHAGLWSATAPATIRARPIFEILPGSAVFLRDGDVDLAKGIAVAAELRRGLDVQRLALALRRGRGGREDLRPVAVDGLLAHDPMDAVEAVSHQYSVRLP